jgi:predicted RNA-binding Zn-ribbon protein involved in translation (DUF1610 family)
MASAAGSIRHHLASLLGGTILMVALVLMIYFGYAGSVGAMRRAKSLRSSKDTSNYMMMRHERRIWEDGQTVVSSVKPALNPPTKDRSAPSAEPSTRKAPVYCDNCGAALTKKCPACGEVNDADAKHCRKCGKPLL